VTDLMRENNFTGTLMSIGIDSHNFSYWRLPCSEQEIRQYLNINEDGCVCFSAYKSTHGDFSEDETEVRSIALRLGASQSSQLLEAFSDYFSNPYREIFATDIGTWDLELTNTEGKIYRYHGSLCARLEVAGLDLSDFVRETLGIENLFVLDGNNNPDRINRLTFDYHNATKIKPSDVIGRVSDEKEIWESTEHLMIDRDQGTLLYRRETDSGHKFYQKYELKEQIENLLDNFDTDDFLSPSADSDENPDDVDVVSGELKTYKMTINYERQSQRVITGRFDKEGLPADFVDLAELVREFIEEYGVSDVLTPSFYNRPRRHSSEVMICSVIFDVDNKNAKTYDYMTVDDSIGVGDPVVVPVGEENREMSAVVEKVDYVEEDSSSNSPYGIKTIIRKLVDD